MLRTGQLLHPASTPASRSTPGASLPGTLVSPRTGLAPAGYRELVAPLPYVIGCLLLTQAPELLDAQHDYPSAAHRHSYARRTAAERANATIKDPATNDISKGWCRVMGLAPMTVMLACVLVVRNLRVSEAFELRQAENQRRAAAGLAPKTRRRRRKTLTELVGAPTANPPP